MLVVAINHGGVEAWFEERREVASAEVVKPQYELLISPLVRVEGFRVLAVDGVDLAAEKRMKSMRFRAS